MSVRVFMFTYLPDEEFDMPLGLGTGAAVIFGATGGVMEAALAYCSRKTDRRRTCKHLTLRMYVVSKESKKLSYNVAGMDVKVAVASGLDKCKRIVEESKDPARQSIILSKLWVVLADVSMVAVSRSSRRYVRNYCGYSCKACRSTL